MTDKPAMSARAIKTGSRVLADLARAKALFQQRAILSLITEGAVDQNQIKKSEEQ